MVDIPAEVQPESAFETISKDMIAAAGRKFYSAANEYHGSVGYEWLQHLVALRPKQIKAELKRLCETWRSLPQVTEIASRAHPQVVSVINRFALIAATLRMAAAAEIVPWEINDIDAAIISCMERWLRQRGNIDTAGELLREIKRRRQMFAATVDDHFIHLSIKDRRLVAASAADQRKMNAELDGEEKFDGYVKDGRVLVRADAWRHLWAGLDANAVRQHLLQARLLIRDRKGNTPSLERMGSKEPPARFYVLALTFNDPT